MTRASRPLEQYPVTPNNVRSLAERTENPRVGGSIPPLATIKRSTESVGWMRADSCFFSQQLVFILRAGCLFLAPQLAVLIPRTKLATKAWCRGQPVNDLRVFRNAV